MYNEYDIELELDCNNILESLIHVVDQINQCLEDDDYPDSLKNKNFCHHKYNN
jgi:hypothetical protein